MSENFKLKNAGDKQHIFDMVRKKYVLLTPEEWVRQQFIAYLVNVKKYPLSLISVERTLRIGSLLKRFDILVYKNALPWMIVECKSENIVLNDNTLSQILAYNSKLKVQYLTLTNGSIFHCFDIANHTWSNVLPDF